MELVIISLSLAISVIGIFLFRLSLRQRSLQIKNKRLATLRKLDEMLEDLKEKITRNEPKEVLLQAIDSLQHQI